MGEDRALDEFLDGTDGDDDDTDDERGDEVPMDDGAEDSTDEAAEVTVSTTVFTPEGAACESCGTSVRRRWRDDSTLVCADCKAW